MIAFVVWYVKGKTDSLVVGKNKEIAFLEGKTHWNVSNDDLDPLKRDKD